MKSPWEEWGSGQPDQRERLLQATVMVVARRGYQSAKVAEVASSAGISLATVYQLVADKEDCFLAAYQKLAAWMSRELTRAVMSGGPEDATKKVLAALVNLADRWPLEFEFVTHDAMHAGPAAMEMRDRVLGAIEALLERAWAQEPERSTIPDLPGKILVGGCVRMIGIQRRRSGYVPRELLRDLLSWADCYRAPRQAHRWRSISPHAAFANGAWDSRRVLVAPDRPRRSRRREPHRARRVQRARILHATMDLVSAKGYANISVANIVTVAKVSREVFYAHFRDRESAFEQTRRVAFEQMIGISAGAFYGAAGDWPEQVWQTGRTFGELMSTSPALARLAFVETYANDAKAKRADALILAFTTFLEGGYRYRPEAAKLPRTVGVALLCGIAEVVSYYVRHGMSRELEGIIPFCSYVVIAPFSGRDAASALVESKVREHEALRAPRASGGEAPDASTKDSPLTHI